MVYAWSEHFCLPISHDEVVHGKGSLVRKMPGDRWQKTGQPARLPRATCGPIPASSCCSWARSSAQTSEWSEERGLDWWLLRVPGPLRACSTACATSTRVYVETPALWEQDNTPDGFEWIDANDAAGNVFSWLRVGRRRLAAGRDHQLLPRRAQRLPARAAGHRTLGPRSSTPTPRLRRLGRGQPRRGRRPRRSPGTARPASATVTLPPLATVWLRYERTPRTPTRRRGCRALRELAACGRMRRQHAVEIDDQAAAEPRWDVGASRTTCTGDPRERRSAPARVRTARWPGRSGPARPTDRRVRRPRTGPAGACAAGRARARR